MTEQKIIPGLYVVATPIGNLADLSARAKHILKGVDIIACEDTRVTGKLLLANLIKKPLQLYHEHNAPAQRPKLLAKIAEGQSIALVSDAGTPLISDPGYKLVAEAQEAGLYVTGIPGPCAAITALSVAGLPTDRFTFIGFPPVKTKARQDWFAAERDNSASLVFYESAKRIEGCLTDAATALGPRPAAVCRELTKKFEEVRKGTLEELALHYRDAGAPKGEIVVVIAADHNKKSSETNSLDTQKILETALKHMSVKSASAFVAELTGARKKDIYQQALALSGKTG